MAFTQAPEAQTYSTQPIPVVYGLDIRPTTVLATPATRLEQGMINLMPHKVGESDVMFADTRPQVILEATIATGTTNPVVRGYYIWEYEAGTTLAVAVVNNVLYYSHTTGSWIVGHTFTTTDINPVGFTEFIDGTNQKSLIVVDGYSGLKITATSVGPTVTITQITDVDFPTPHIPFPVFLDGYLFLAKRGTGDIYNSDLNDPTAWTAGNFASSEVYPDDIRALVKVDNFILAVGAQGSEYLYDAGNAVGSPLQRLQGGLVPYGTEFPYSIAVTKDTLVMLARGNDGQHHIRVVREGKADTLEAPWLTDVLNIKFRDAGTNLNTQAKRVVGHLHRHRGDLYYSIRIPTLDYTTDVGFFVYSFECKMWTEWTGVSYGQYPIIMFAQPTYNAFDVQGCGVEGGTIFQARLLNNGTAQDILPSGTVNIPNEVRTPRLDFGTLNRKAMHRLGLRMINFQGDTTTDFTVYVNDDDNTWVSVGTLKAGSSVDFPFLTQLGTFRQRAIKITYTGTGGIRLTEAHADINKGQQ